MTPVSLGPRLSCGYRDFKLENQGYFFKTLNLAQAGIDVLKKRDDVDYEILTDDSVGALHPKLKDANETVKLSLSKPKPGAALGARKTATLTIIGNA